MIARLLSELLLESKKQTEILTNIHKENKKMNEALQALIAAFDVATNKVADNLQALVDKVKELTEAVAGEEATTIQEVISAFEPQLAKLRALGADPENPVPAPEPEPEPEAPEQA